MYHLLKLIVFGAHLQNAYLKSRTSSQTMKPVPQMPAMGQQAEGHEQAVWSNSTMQQKSKDFHCNIERVKSTFLKFLLAVCLVDSTTHIMVTSNSTIQHMGCFSEYSEIFKLFLECYCWLEFRSEPVGAWYYSLVEGREEKPRAKDQKPQPKIPQRDRENCAPRSEACEQHSQVWH